MHTWRQCMQCGTPHLHVQIGRAHCGVVVIVAALQLRLQVVEVAIGELQGLRGGDTQCTLQASRTGAWHDIKAEHRRHGVWVSVRLRGAGCGIPAFCSAW
jgi:hypothetical protein